MILFKLIAYYKICEQLYYADRRNGLYVGEIPSLLEVSSKSDRQ